MKALIIVDMQNDFITGSLANPAAAAIVSPIVDFIMNWNPNDKIILTRDTHNTSYLQTAEGKHLPIEHCINGTPGWCVEDRITRAARPFAPGYVNKNTFGTLNWKWVGLGDNHYDEIVICGTCTDICVISNALILKATYPETKITVMSKLCAGLTPAKHEAALEVMRSCQIEVI